MSEIEAVITGHFPPTTTFTTTTTHSLSFSLYRLVQGPRLASAHHQPNHNTCLTPHQTCFFLPSASSHYSPHSSLASSSASAHHTPHVAIPLPFSASLLFSLFYFHSLLHTFAHNSDSHTSSLPHSSLPTSPVAFLPT